LTTKFTELQKRASVIPRLSKELTDHRAENAKLTQRVNSLSSHEAEVATVMKSLVPQLPAYSADSFREYSNLFIKGFARQLTARVSERFNDTLDRVVRRTAAFARQSAQFDAKVAAVTAKCAEFRGKFMRAARSLNGITASYTDSLSLLFPPSHGVTVQSSPAAIHAQLAKVQALLRSLFRLLPDPKMPLPENLYGLALGLRRFLEATDIPQTLGDLTEDLPLSAIALPESTSPGLVPFLLSTCQNLGQMLNSSMPLATLVDYLSSCLSVNPPPPATDAGFTSLTQELSRQLRQRDEVKSRFSKYADAVQSLLAGIAKSLPRTLDSLVETLRHPDI
jgi:ABC-type transporter Mla subunit MlaD